MLKKFFYFLRSWSCWLLTQCSVLVTTWQAALITKAVNKCWEISQFRHSTPLSGTRMTPHNQAEERRLTERNFMGCELEYSITFFLFLRDTAFLSEITKCSFPQGKDKGLWGKWIKMVPPSLPWHRHSPSLYYCSHKVQQRPGNQPGNQTTQGRFWRTWRSKQNSFRSLNW